VHWRVVQEQTLLTAQIGVQIGFVYLACQVTSVAIAAAFEKAMPPVLARLAPPTVWLPISPRAWARCY
jgi:hypothetical protein